ncbi:peptidylprolyl isomerase [Pseudoalteromonas sp. DL-6]|uniref:peptidylprolyl isomerase n=1 Tax=Pseudoalteromonas sp. DL-6 TaxID=1390185 RepID=UPI00103DFC79|nr:peptidylprolyl isomerase [Pseudoalteromonas sp. DL-6]QBJ63301.1 peptidyl-prolyl cis-trans isomerase [Pseudoalteromonas sp. DL-6]
MKKFVITVLASALLGGCAQQSILPSAPVKSLTSSEIIASATDEQWRWVNPENILKLTLPTGAAYIELNPALAPKHSANIKKLARQGFYQGTHIYRFVEGFVAQGGDSTGKKLAKTEKSTVPAEFYLTTTEPLLITEMGEDGYAPITGFLNGFAVAQNETRDQTWQIHCHGVFAMARDNDINSASTEFFVTIGQGPRYLDKNITVFGRVLTGMAHFHQLARTPKGGSEFNPITDLQVLADVSSDSSRFKVMKTDSDAFKQLISARGSRSEGWFAYSHNYIDVCGMPVPTKQLND